MKRIDIGQILQILANIGVIAGIVFLAFEVRQYDHQLKGQSRFNYYNNRAEVYSSIGLNPEPSGLAIKNLKQEPITAAESLRLRTMVLSGLTLWEYEYGEHQLGRITEAEFGIELKKRTFHAGFLPYKEVWESYQHITPKAFQQFMLEKIIPNNNQGTPTIIQLNSEGQRDGTKQSQ